MQITNNHSQALGLPNGQVVAPGDTVTIPEADVAGITGNAVLKAWGEKKIISIKDAPKATGGTTGTQAGSEADERTTLMARLDELKVSYDKRVGVAKLRELVADAEKKAAATNGGTGIQAGSEG